MAVVEIIYDLKAPSWVTGNTNVPKFGEPIYLTNGTYAFGDGATQVKDLTFFGGGSGSLSAGPELKIVSSTVSFKGGQRYNVLDYGLTGDGTTNDRAALNTLLNTTAPSGSTIYFPKGTYRLASAISVTDKYFYFISDFATILVDGNFSGLAFNSTSNVTLLAGKNSFENLIFLGTGTGSSQVGITFGVDASKFTVLNCTFDNFGNAGIKADVLNSPNGAGGIIHSCKFLNNAYGFFGLDGSEYVTISGCYFRNNTQCVETTAGNQKYIGNAMSRNGHGINVYAGPNDAHGIISNNDINHCGFAIRFNGIVNGMTVSDNHIYSANISVVSSTGVMFSGGEQDVSAYTFTSNTGVRFENVTFVGTAGTQSITGTAPIYNNCFNLNGDAAINPNTFISGYSSFTSGSFYARVGTSTNGLKFQGLVGSTSVPAIYSDVATPSGTNYSIALDSNDLLLNGAASVQLRIANSNILNVNSAGVQISTLTTGRVMFTGASGALKDDNSLRWNNSTTALTLDNTSGIPSVNLLGVNGSIAIESASDTYFSTASAINGDLIFRPKGNEMTRISGTYVSFGATKLFYWDDTNNLLYVNANSGASANTTLHVNGNARVVGNISTALVQKTTNYSVLVTDSTIECTSGTFNVTLPTAVGCSGRVYVVKNSGTGIITVDTTSSQTIDGSLTAIMAIQYSSITLQSNGSNWIII